MSTSTPRAKTVRPLADLQARAAALVAEVRDAVVAYVHGSDPAADDSAAGILSAAPPGVCVRLVHLMQAARAAGHTQADLTAHLGAEDRLIFEMVAGMYDTACLTPLPLLLESVGRLRDALA